jgi:hypothetical protein
MKRGRREVDVRLVIADSSPLITLASVDRLDLFGTFAVPIHFPDQIAYEATKSENDEQGRVRKWLQGAGTQLTIVATAVGEGFKVRRAADPTYSGRNLGELAVEEYAHTVLATRRSVGRAARPIRGPRRSGASDRAAQSRPSVEHGGLAAGAREKRNRTGRT